MHMQEKFQKIITEYESQLLQDSRAFNQLGFTKLVAALLVLVCVVFLFSSSFAIWAILMAAVFFAGSVVLWVRHYRLDNKIQYAKNIVSICNRHISRISGEWANFEDTGKEFVNPTHYYASDLDIVGDKSFFQFLNTTHTWHGRQKFAGDLLHPCYTTTEIKERQTAIAELSQDINFSNDIECYLSQIGANKLDEKLAAELTDNTPIKLWLANDPSSKWAKFVRLIICFKPVLTVILLATGVLFQVGPLLIAGIIFTIDQAFICYAEKNNLRKYLGIMDRLPYKLSKYVKVIDVLTAKQFSSNKLNQIKTQLEVASEAVRELESISNKLSFRANPLIYIALNVLLLWDLHCAFLLERWKMKYSSVAMQWFTTIGEFESLLAFSHLPNVCENVCLPEIVEGRKTIKAKCLGHPLLLNRNRVSNDIEFDNNILIISGSNMSGKTTFMRTVGVNLLLAKTGSFVCANQMTCSKFEIITSMRIADDLNQGISTFYAELKRIKLILDKAAENDSTIFLIDEIFKGTNSVDRLAGADAVISKLAGLNSAGMVSTHDLELCKLAELTTRIVNYSFCENYEDGAIHFDYKLRKGQSVTTNAKFLMEMVGIVRN